MDFLKEHWLWIVVPFGLLAFVLLALFLLAGGEAGSTFDYPIF